MADANTIIRNLGMQVAQLTVDKAILEAENGELKEALAAAGVVELGEVEDRPLAAEELAAAEEPVD